MKDKIQDLLDEYLGSPDNIYEPKVRRDCADELLAAFREYVESCRPVEGDIRDDEDWSTSERQLVDQFEESLLSGLEEEKE